MFVWTSLLRRTFSGSKPRWMVRLAAAVLSCLLLVAPGCQVTSPRNLGDSRVHDEKDFSANTEQMRLRMRSLVQPMSGVVVAAADQILAGTTDPAVRREALLWKIQAVPALREALFQPNPKTALLDTWVLTFQMADYFETGAGAKNLGEAHVIALSTAQHLEADMARIANAMTFSGDMSKARQFARKWAADHPITQSLASRESTLSLVTEKDLPEALATREAMGSLLVSVDDLNRRLEIYSSQLLDQSRWQEELFAMDQVRQYQLEKAVPLAESAVTSVGRAIDALDRTLPALERSLAVVEKSPAVIAAEREATMKALAAEITHTTTFLQEERVATLKQLSIERAATVRELNDAVSQQRAILTRDVEATASNAVDHVYFRAVQLAAAFLVAVFFSLVLLILITRWVFRSPNAPTSRRPAETPKRPPQRTDKWRSFRSHLRTT